MANPALEAKLLQVSLAGAHRRGDDELRGSALQILMWDIGVPSECVDVTVRDGWVNLTNDVSFPYRSDAVYHDVASLYGVIGVANSIQVRAA